MVRQLIRKIVDLYVQSAAITNRLDHLGDKVSDPLTKRQNIARQTCAIIVESTHKLVQWSSQLYRRHDARHVRAATQGMTCAVEFFRHDIWCDLVAAFGQIVLDHPKVPCCFLGKDIPQNRVHLV